jgi:hypothetical protein
MYSFLADLVVLLHFAFVLFVVLGGLLVLRWWRVIWVHVPSAIWGALISFFGWTCPLTPLENWLRELAGETGYDGGFVENYVVPLLYPGQLTRTLQIVLGMSVLAVNAVIYTAIARRWRAGRRRQRATAG